MRVFFVDGPLDQMAFSQLLPGGIPFVVGGGNDQSCPNALGMIEALKAKTPSTATKPPSVGVINIDAHFDVRPRKLGQVHSGSPFRELMEDGATSSFLVD